MKRTDRFIDGAKDFINFPNLGLVVQISWGIEEGHFFFFICSPWKWSHRERQWLEWWEIWACLVVRRMYDVFCLVGIVIAELSFNYLGGNF